MKTKPVVAVVLLAVTASLTGCIKVWQENLDIKTYMVQTSREAKPAEQVMGKKLWIDTVSMLPPYGIRNLILRTSDVEFETSYYTELLMSPADNFRNEFYRWFASSGIFENVSIVTRSLMSHSLGVTVMDFYGDTDKNEVVLTIKVTLFDHASKGEEVLCTNDYTETVSIDEVSDETLIRAYNQALSKILTAAEKDIVKALK